ncbi:hypothetical protein Trydic_g4499 [Trypoxylus dichotomus]
MNQFILVVIVYVTYSLADNGYTTKYDNGTCSPDGAELKKVLPDVIETGCSKCNEKQKNGSKVILKHLIENEPEIWKQLEKKYDPEVLL